MRKDGWTNKHAEGNSYFSRFYDKHDPSTVVKFMMKTGRSYTNSQNKVNFVHNLIFRTVETSFKVRKKAKCNIK
jgi:hypothetical protein